MDNSMDSANSSRFEDVRRGKMESLYKAFNDLNWDKQKSLTAEEIRYFLNINSENNKFDSILVEKLLNFMGMDDSNTITVEDFIDYYMKFDSDLQKGKEEINNKLLSKKNSLNNLEEQCNKYKNEQLNSEGLCENAKLTIEISDMEIRTDFGDKNMVKIIIEILYNNEVKQKIFDVNPDENEINKIFEFKPKSKTDYFVVILKCISDQNEEIEIGRAEFPLNEITMQEEYSAQIDIPDCNNEDSVGAIINAKILLYWSDYQFFVEKKKKTEKIIEKIQNTINETDKYCKIINNIYLKNMKIQQQPNMDNIQWNDNIIKPSNENPKYSYIDIDNGPKMNNDEFSQPFRNNNAFEINTNDDYRNNNNSKSLNFIKFLGLCILGLAFSDGFYRNEFPNQLLGLLIFLNCYNLFGYNSERVKFFNKFNFYLCLALLLLDIIWMFNYFSLGTHDKYEGGYNKFTKIVVAISIIAKGFCSVILFNKK
jgi:hypothetical protein